MTCYVFDHDNDQFKPERHWQWSGIYRDDLTFNSDLDYNNVNASHNKTVLSSLHIHGCKMIPIFLMFPTQWLFSDWRFAKYCQWLQVWSEKKQMTNQTKPNQLYQNCHQMNETVPVNIMNAKTAAYSYTYTVSVTNKGIIYISTIQLAYLTLLQASMYLLHTGN